MAVPRWQCSDGGGEVRGGLSEDLEDPVVFVEWLAAISPQDLAVRTFLDPVDRAEVGSRDVDVEHRIFVVIFAEALGGLDAVGVLCVLETSLKVSDLCLMCDVSGHLRLSPLLECVAQPNCDTSQDVAVDVGKGFECGEDGAGGHGGAGAKGE